MRTRLLIFALLVSGQANAEMSEQDIFQALAKQCSNGNVAACQELNRMNAPENSQEYKLGEALQNMARGIRGVTQPPMQNLNPCFPAPDCNR